MAAVLGTATGLLVVAGERNDDLIAQLRILRGVSIEATEEDRKICESVQRGMHSRAFTGGFFAPMEDQSLDIRHWYEARMGDGWRHA